MGWDLVTSDLRESTWSTRLWPCKATRNAVVLKWISYAVVVGHECSIQLNARSVFMPDSGISIACNRACFWSFSEWSESATWKANALHPAAREGASCCASSCPESWPKTARLSGRGVWQAIDWAPFFGESCGVLVCITSSWYHTVTCGRGLGHFRKEIQRWLERHPTQHQPLDMSHKFVTNSGQL